MKNALRSEVLKITTVPGLWVGALLATIATPLLSLLVVAGLLMRRRSRTA